MIKYALFSKKSLDTEIGLENHSKLKENSNIDVHVGTTIKKIFGEISPEDFYYKGKSLLKFDNKKVGNFQTCKPSAHYQLPLISGCIGMCEYCYLNTRFSDKPYTNIYTNVDEILDRAKKYIEERNKVTIFEGSSTSDPVAVEKYSHSLKQAIKFFSDEPLGYFRFVTKYTDVDSFLDIEHKNKTEIRFSINTDYVIDNFEHRTASLNKRLEASQKVMKAGYPSGFLIAPIIVYDNFLDDYIKLIDSLNDLVPINYPHHVTFELITHRYTKTAKNHILQVFPETLLPMNEDDRKFKYGQFGYGKYVYDKETMQQIEDTLVAKIKELPFNTTVKYFI